MRSPVRSLLDIPGTQREIEQALRSQIRGERSRQPGSRHRLGYRPTVRSNAKAAGSVLARSQGVFNVAAGLWPLIHRRSFEALFGPKRDYRLAATVALLMAGNGTVQLSAPSTAEGTAFARRVGVATAATLASVDGQRESWANQSDVPCRRCRRGGMAMGLAEKPPNLVTGQSDHFCC